MNWTITIGDFLNLISVLGAAVSIYVGLRERIAVVETKVDISIKDIDSIAEYVGTPRARARKFKENNIQENKVK